MRSYAQALGERRVGNHAAAEAFAAKAEALKKKHGIVSDAALTACAGENDQQLQRHIELCERVPNGIEVVIAIVEPGMTRLVHRVTSKELALKLIKDGAALFVRSTSSSDFIFRPQEVAEPNKEKPICF